MGRPLIGRGTAWYISVIDELYLAVIFLHPVLEHGLIDFDVRVVRGWHVHAEVVAERG